MKKKCKCNLPENQCVRDVQTDFVKNNALPCRLPQTEAEAQNYQIEKYNLRSLRAVRFFNLLFLDILFAILASILSLIIWLWLEGFLG